MQDILNALSLNTDAVSLSLATGIATVLVMALKFLFTLARRLAQKTPTTLDDKVVDETEIAFKEKSKNL